KEYVSPAQKSVKDHGGEYVAAGPGTQIAGNLPHGPGVILRWQSMEALPAWHNSPDFQAALKIGEKYAKINIVAVNGLKWPLRIRDRGAQKAFLIWGDVMPTLVGFGTFAALCLSVSRCVTVEDEVASLDGLVAGKAGVVHRLAGGFAAVKLSEPPAAGR